MADRFRIRLGVETELAPSSSCWLWHPAGVSTESS
jgi:hypothetical protein